MIEDPRLDPRVRRALAAAPPGGPAAALPRVTLESSYEQCLDWVSAMERTLMSQDAAALAGMPAFDDVVERKEAIPGDEGAEIDLYLDMPKERGAKLPCVVHIHGGGMAFTTATRPAAVRWRKTLAQQGMLVVGVEFRNAGGVLGNHPFPGGLNDCARRSSGSMPIGTAWGSPPWWSPASPAAAISRSRPRSRPTWKGGSTRSTASSRWPR